GFLSSSSYRLARFDAMEHNRRIAADLGTLRQRARGPVQRALAGAVRPGVERLADYLLAAREAAGKDGREHLAEIARTRKLDADLLGRWVAHLLTAARDDTDPLHPWTKVGPSLAPLVENWHKRQTEADAALRAADVVIDYGKPTF